MLEYVCLIICFFCPESPQWLMVHGYREEGIKTLNKIAIFNGSDACIPEDAIFEEVSYFHRQDRVSGRYSMNNFESPIAGNVNSTHSP